MKHTKPILRMLTLMAIIFLFTLSAFAHDDLQVYPTESESRAAPMVLDLDVAQYGIATIAETDTPSDGEEPIPTYTLSNSAISFILALETYQAEPFWDVSRYSIGYGNSYDSAKKMFGSDITSITEEQAFQLFQAELVPTEEYMNRFFVKQGIRLNQNQYDALISFTYNVGIGWTTYQNAEGSWCLLRTMLEDDPTTWTAERVKAAFGSWVMAGGQILEGLVQRRASEAEMFLTPYDPSHQNDPVVRPNVPNPDEDEDKDEDDQSSPTLSFSDVSENQWYYPYIMEACQLELMLGMGNGTFQPEGYLTRAQLVQLLVNLEGDVSLDEHTDTGFSDVPTDRWYTGPLAWAVEQGYVLGMSDGTFRPDEPVTREQLCAILARYLRDKGIEPSQSPLTFSDADLITEYAREDVDFCTALGLIQGMGDGSFSPTTGTTRAQAATVLLRMIDVVD